MIAIARALVPVSATAVLLLVARVGEAQDTIARELRESQERLEEIRAERDQLQRGMDRIGTQMHDVTDALANIAQQAAVSANLLRELDFQSSRLIAQVEATTRELLRSRDKLRERKVVLRQRLRFIYKRGPLHTTRVLLGARSFSDLLNRYKYLHIVASYDQLLIAEISALEEELSERERELAESRARLQQLRAERLSELAQLQRLESDQERMLLSFRQEQQQAAGRLDQLSRDEARLTDVIAELERRRAEAEARAGDADEPSGPGTLSADAVGTLPWPADGTLLYRFGPERRPNGVVLRRNGIGIAANPGQSVHAVEAGTVAMAGPFEGYGPTVMISHGGGYYTVYLFLDGIQVTEGQRISARDVVGTVGGARTPEGTHIEFQLWGPAGSESPVPVDPLNWLQRRTSQ